MSDLSEFTSDQLMTEYVKRICEGNGHPPMNPQVPLKADTPIYLTCQCQGQRYEITPVQMAAEE